MNPVQQQRVLDDIRLEVPAARYTPEMLTFRSTVEAEWGEWLTDHPDGIAFGLTEADRLALEVIAEKGGDHFYGAWKGGKAKSGGGPSGGADGDPLTSKKEELAAAQRDLKSEQDKYGAANTAYWDAGGPGPGRPHHGPSRAAMNAAQERLVKAENDMRSPERVRAEDKAYKAYEKRAGKGAQPREQWDRARREARGEADVLDSMSSKGQLGPRSEGFAPGKEPRYAATVRKTPAQLDAEVDRQFGIKSTPTATKAALDSKYGPYSAPAYRQAVAAATSPQTGRIIQPMPKSDGGGVRGALSKAFGRQQHQSQQQAEAQRLVDIVRSPGITYVKSTREGAMFTLTEADRLALRASGHPAPLAEKGGDHFYGAWKGGSAKSGGGPSGGSDGDPLTSKKEEGGALSSSVVKRDEAARANMPTTVTPGSAMARAAVADGPALRTMAVSLKSEERNAATRELLLKAGLKGDAPLNAATFAKLDPVVVNKFAADHPHGSVRAEAAKALITQKSVMSRDDKTVLTASIATTPAARQAFMRAPDTATITTGAGKMTKAQAEKILGDVRTPDLIRTDVLMGIQRKFGDVRESVAEGDTEVRALLVTEDDIREAVVLLDKSPTSAKVLAYGDDVLVIPEWTGGFDTLGDEYVKPEPLKPYKGDGGEWNIGDAADALRKLASLKRREHDEGDQQAMLQTAIGALADYLKAEATEATCSCGHPADCDCTDCDCGKYGGHTGAAVMESATEESIATAEAIAESVGEGPFADVVREAGRRNSAKDAETLMQIVKLVKSLGIEMPVDDEGEATAAVVAAAESIDYGTADEDIMFREAGAYGDYVTLAEGDAQFDAATRTVYVTPIKPGWGNKRDNNYYPTETLKEATQAGRFNNLKMYRDHPRKSDEKDLPERSVKDWFATTREAVWDDKRQRPRVPIKVHSDEDFRKWQEAPEQVALSILGGGMARPGQAEGRKGRILESISRVASVDWVTEAGAGGGIDFAESASSKEMRDMGDNIDMDDLTPEVLAEARPDIYEHLVGMGKVLAGITAEEKAEAKKVNAAAKGASGDEGEATTKESAIPEWFAPFAPVLTAIATREAAATTDADKAEAKKVVDAAIAATTLPATAKAVVARHFAEATIGEGRAYADETVLKEAIAAEVRDAEELLGIKKSKSSVVGLGEGAAHADDTREVTVMEAVRGDIEARWGKESFPSKDQLVYTAEQVANPGTRSTLVVTEGEPEPATNLSEAAQSVQAGLAARF